MKTIELQFLLRAASPISQSMGTEANVGMLNREPVVQPDGELRDVPIVSGNAMRHACREAIVNLQLDALGLLKRGAFDVPDMVRFLYNGGSGAGEGNTIKLDEARAMRSLIPSVALLGGSGRGRLHYGQTEVSGAMLVCQESSHLLPPWQREEIASADYSVEHATVYEGIHEEFRHDNAVKPSGQFLLSDAARVALADLDSRRERAGDEGDEAEIERTKGGMMPYSSQIVRRGTLWTWSVVGHLADEREEIAFRAMVSAFLRRPVVGGKRRVGFGRFEVFAARGMDHLRPAEALKAMTDAEVMGETAEAPFLALLAERAEESRGWLTTPAKAAK